MAVRLIRNLGMALSAWLFVPVVALAFDWQPSWPTEWQGDWKGHADVGYSAASGNTENEHLNAALGIEYKIAPWTHQLEFTALKGEENAQANAERYLTQFKSKYALTEVSYVFGALAYEYDEFGGVRERTSEKIGYGRQLLDTDLHQLEAEIGLGARQSELQDGSEEDEAILHGGFKYHRHLSESASFDQALLIEAGESNTYVESISALKLSIVGNLFAKLGYTIKYNDTVPKGIENRDTYTTVNLSYEF